MTYKVELRNTVIKRANCKTPILAQIRVFFARYGFFPNRLCAVAYDRFGKNQSGFETIKFGLKSEFCNWLKTLKTLPKTAVKKISKKIDTLENNPKPPGYKKIKGTEGLYRIRVGDYRILYEVFENKLVILVIRIGHRKEIYNHI